MVKYDHSEKMTSADYQQERLRTGSWISGFTDGEGCFSVSIIKNSTTKYGKQIFPEFVVTQSAKSLPALEEIKNYFECGSIVLNKRYDNHNEHLYRYCVRSIKDLDEKIIPFFKIFPLRTYKKNDFEIFEKVVGMMIRKEHLQTDGWNKILSIISTMNRKKIRS